MPITPIDIKTNFMANNDASRLREGQKAQESGQGQLVAQNQEKDQAKTDTIQNTQATEHKAIRKEDEDAEKEKGQPDTTPRKNAQGEDIPDETKPAPAKDIVRGVRIDLKA